MELLITTAVPHSLVSLCQSELSTQCYLALPSFNSQHPLYFFRTSSTYLRLRCRIPVTPFSNVFQTAVPTVGVTD